MGFDKVDKIWMSGKFVNWDDAKIHVLSHVVHYGSSVFEGGRAYASDRGPAVFRLQDHVDRLDKTEDKPMTLTISMIVNDHRF